MGIAVSCKFFFSWTSQYSSAKCSFIPLSCPSTRNVSQFSILTFFYAKILFKMQLDQNLHVKSKLNNVFNVNFLLMPLSPSLSIFQLPSTQDYYYTLKSPASFCLHTLCFNTIPYSLASRENARKLWEDGSHLFIN